MTANTTAPVGCPVTLYVHRDSRSTYRVTLVPVPVPVNYLPLAPHLPAWLSSCGDEKSRSLANVMWQLAANERQPETTKPGQPWHT